MSKGAPATPGTTGAAALRGGAAIMLGLVLSLGLALHPLRALADGIDPHRLQRPFGDSIGLVVKFYQGQSQRDLATLSELGVRWVRDGVSWPDIETEPGRYAPMPAEFAERLAYYRKHDIGLVFTLAYQNEAAYPPSAQSPHAAIDPPAYGRYAVAVARQLQAAGVRFVLEVWNEPHNFVLRPQLGGQWNGKPPSPWLDHYVRMVNEVVRQVKTFDPSIAVMTDDDMWVLHYWFLEMGLAPALDGFAFHPYTTLEPEKTMVSADTDWTAPFQVVDADRSFRSAVRRLREQGQRKLGKTPRLWITEWGYAAGTRADKDEFDPLTVAAYLPRAYIGAFAAGVEATFWFSSFDSVDGPMGLIDGDGRRRPAYQALATLSAQLGRYRLVRQWGDGGAMQPLQAYLFEHDGRYRLVYWHLVDDDAPRPQRIDTGERRPLRVTHGADVRLRAVDLLGRPIDTAVNASTDTSPNAAGTTRVLALPISGAPVYLSIEVPAERADAALRDVQQQFLNLPGATR